MRERSKQQANGTQLASAQHNRAAQQHRHLSSVSLAQGEPRERLHFGGGVASIHYYEVHLSGPGSPWVTGGHLCRLFPGRVFRSPEASNSATLVAGLLSLSSMPFTSDRPLVYTLKCTMNTQYYSCRDACLAWK